jgi:hypothetical protein
VQQLEEQNMLDKICLIIVALKIEKAALMGRQN